MHITLICADADIWAIGMRDISAVLKEAGHNTRLIFAGSVEAVVGHRTLAEIRALAQDSDIIGISSMSRGSGRAKDLLASLRPLGKLTVWGGMHPTIFPDDCVDHADLVCRGEGEDFMLELATMLAAGRDFHDIHNGAYRSGGRIVLNELRPLIEDLDKLPLPDFSFEKEYILDDSGKFLPHDTMKDASHILFTGSRGCIYGCHYCSNSQLKSFYKGKGRFARKMSVRKFVQGANECRRLFPQAKYFYFTDEEFLSRPIEELREFAETYPSEVGLPFECMVCPLQVTEEKVDLLAKAGIWRIMVGVESGSDGTKKHVFNRPANNESVMRSASIVSKHPEVVAYYYFIIGNPYETRQDLLDTIHLVQGMPPTFFIRTYSLVFIPGTKLFQKACSDGMIRGLADSGYETDFLGGLDLKGPAWKQNNLYLNSLIAMMAGKFTKAWMGLLPRCIVPLLIRPKVIDFCDKHTWIGKTIARMAKGGQWVRRSALILVSSIVKNPKTAFGLKFLLRKKPKKTAVSA